MCLSLNFEQRSSVLILNQPHCSLNVSLGRMTLRGSRLSQDFNFTRLLHRVNEVSNGLLSIPLDLHASVPEAFKPSSHPTNTMCRTSSFLLDIDGSNPASRSVYCKQNFEWMSAGLHLELSIVTLDFW
jgi:hypothetical protein